MEIFEALDAAHSEFERRLVLVGVDQWGTPTPCAEWDVRALVNHVVGGARFQVQLLLGATFDEARSAAVGSVGSPGRDPTEDYRNEIRVLRAAFHEPGALDVVCHHRIGDMPGAQLLRLRVFDVSVHAWDLARAISADQQLPDELLAIAWDHVRARGSTLQANGVFAAPTGPTDAAVALQTRILHATGRTP
jgi:uncharacterized protein (TIGR03086 family)